MAFRHPSGDVARVSKTFSVSLPPWHATARPLEFAAKARYACLWSELLTHMVRVKTLLAYTLEVAEFPPGTDSAMCTGFAATAPRVAYTEDGAKRAVKGYGGGRAKSFKGQMSFTGNHQVSPKRDAYPRCHDLKKTLAIGREEWASATIQLTDKYQFPIEATVGRVVESIRVPKEDLAHLGTGQAALQIR